MSAFSDKNRDRIRLLAALAQLSGSSPTNLVRRSDLAKTLGVRLQDLPDLEDYLIQEGLAKRWSLDSIGLTHNGVRAVEEVERQAPAMNVDFILETLLSAESSVPPPDISESLAKFRKDHVASKVTAFIMMRFGQTRAHKNIVGAIRDTLGPLGITALRADDKQYHDDLLPNILTYLFGCTFGIAVFERIEADEFSPNVSLEVGYTMALKKPVCLLKDKTLKTLPADLVGRLYQKFDPQDVQRTIQSA